ncbi:MAG TPA: DMT family transporter, partial [Stellaceae bacterium]|nr:DMT family transporter [Stellaceae bacterium]
LGVGAAGVIALTAGTLYFGRFCRDAPLLAGSAVQFLAASAVSIAATLLFETPRLDWTETALAAIAWNAGIVSLGGMALYFFMLKEGTAARATANFYLVPGATAVLAWLFLGERLSPEAALGLLVASAGCRLVAAPPGERLRRRRIRP